MLFIDTFLFYYIFTIHEFRWLWPSLWSCESWMLYILIEDRKCNGLLNNGWRKFEYIWSLNGKFTKIYMQEITTFLLLTVYPSFFWIFVYTILYTWHCLPKAIWFFYNQGFFKPMRFKEWHIFAINGL